MLLLICCARMGVFWRSCADVLDLILGEGESGCRVYGFVMVGIGWVGRCISHPLWHFAVV